MRLPFLKTLAVLFTALAGSAGAADWVARAQLPKGFANLYMDCRWEPRRGLHLKLTEPDGIRRVVIELSRDDGSLELSPKGKFPLGSRETPVFHLDRLPAGALDEVEVTLKFRPCTWAIYVAGRPIAIVPAPFLPPVVVAQDRREVSGEDPGDVYVQKVEDFAFEDRFLVPEGDDNALSGWETTSGEWLLHTAVDNAVARQNIAPGAANKPEPTRSPNFYSLRGKGSGALLTAGHHFYDAYRFEAAVRVDPGEMGLAFQVDDGGALHAFTLRMEPGGHEALLVLWRRAGNEETPREVLAAVRVPLTSGQWVKLGVRTSQDRVRCFIDRTKVIDTETELGVGGRFGLYADSETGIRFDDVAAATDHTLDLTNPDLIKRHALAGSGNFFDWPRLKTLFRSEPPANRMQVAATFTPKWLVFGSTAHPPHVVAATFKPPNGASSLVGLLTGYTDPTKPYYRFTCRRTKSGDYFLLETVRGSSAKRLERLRVPGSGNRHTPIRLMCDATEGTTLRCFRNGELVLVHHAPEPVAGAAGLLVGAGTDVTLSRVTYAPRRDDVYRNQFEKNQFFIEDPFMRHWSSPEGQWIDDRHGHVWHKSDFLGRFLLRLPYIPGSEVHLGVPEGELTGELVLRAGPQGLSLEDPQAETPPGGTAAVATIPRARLAAFDGDTLTENTDRWYSIHCEGHWVWLTSGDVVLAKVSRPPLRGRRIRIAGFPAEQLHHSYVERFNVKDFLFTESLHPWTLNGGSWEVVNRFQCQPRWSHMDGESVDGLAALWAKYQLAGDFCIEMYAGIRHGAWYQRPGDLNLTVLNADNTPSQGYTVTCTGWDRDHSQLLTRFFKNGELVGQTDKYLVPRVREGSVRRGYNPLVNEGRPVHGAWYYIKLRRAGNRMQYWFDNELVHEWEDEAPLTEGGLGIWTFMNSMVVARVKAAAEHIEPRPVPFQRVSVEEAAAGHPTAGPPPPLLRRDGDPLGLMAAELWTVDDPVGRSHLAWHAAAAAGPYFAVTNALGGGNMLTRCNAAGRPATKLAGWRFFVKRTPHARFNVHYTLGEVGADGTYVPLRSFFHQISGETFNRGPHTLTGTTAVPATPGTAADWHKRGDWTLVEVWLPGTPAEQELLTRPTVQARLTGFGNLQPSDTLQGLTGNGPGEAYAVRDVTPICYTAPKLTVGEQQPQPGPLQVVDERDLTQRTTFATVEALQNWIDALDEQGFVRKALIAGRLGRQTRAQLAWIRPYDDVPLACSWDSSAPSAVLLSTAAEYPERRFLFATVALAGTNVPVETRTLQERIVRVPRQPDLMTAHSPQLPLVVTAGDTAHPFSLDWRDAPANEPPALLGIDGLSPFVDTFEGRTLGRVSDLDPLRMSLHHADPLQGEFLRTSNHGTATRLQTTFPADLDLARFPALLFRYRGQTMSRFSIALRGAYHVQATEPLAAAQPVRHAPEPVLDGTWQTWLGLVTDAVKGLPYHPSLLSCGSLRFASVHKSDQTGLFSELDLDNMVFGPAVKGAAQLRCVPRYFDFDGVSEVSYALRAGPESYHDLEPAEVEALPWAGVPAGEAVTPDPEGLPDGLCHLFLKAVDSRGAVSRVTDVPVLVDRQPLTATHAFEPTPDVEGNGTRLRVSFATGGGAPLDIATLKIAWNGQPVPATGPLCQLSHLPDADTLYINWPYVFRQQLDAAKDGETDQIILAGIQDGAGNALPDISIPVSINWAADKTRPTLTAVHFPPNILWCSRWDAPGQASHDFQAPRGYPLSVVQQADEAGFLKAQPVSSRVNAWRAFPDGGWKVDAFPYLALRIRLSAFDQKTRVNLRLECTDGKTLTIPLGGMAKRKAKDTLLLPQPFTWQPNVWQPILLDIRGLLRGTRETEEFERLLDVKNLDEAARKEEALQEAEKAVQKVVVNIVRIMAGPLPAGGRVELQSVSVFAPWRPADQIAIDAYDASGIAGLTCKGSRSDDRTERAIAPQQLAPLAGPDGWVEVRARDKAGNLSRPVHVPVQPK